MLILVRLPAGAAVGILGAEDDSARTLILWARELRDCAATVVAELGGRVKLRATLRAVRGAMRGGSIRGVAGRIIRRNASPSHGYSSEFLVDA